MNLTLRKAHKITKQLEELVSTTRSSLQQDTVQGDITITDLVDANDRWNERFKNHVENRLNIIDILYRIRARIAIINSRKNNDGESIDTLVTRKNCVEQKMQAVSFANQKWDSNTHIDPNIRYQNDLTYSEAQSQRTSITTSDTRKNFHRLSIGNLTEDNYTGYNELYVDLKREQEQITDKLAYMNNFHQIELTDDEVEFLTSLQLI